MLPAKLVLKIRPAPLASFVASLFGLNKRRLYSTPQGAFFINPVSVFGSTLMDREYEPDLRRVLEHYLAPGGVFVDLGANEGYFTVLASRIVGPQGRVVAVEPQSRLQEVIRTNLEANQCNNVQVVRGVVSSANGTLRLSLAPAAVAGSSSLFRHTRYPLPTEEVPAYRLADLLTQTGVTHCDLMKVDIEGAEYDVFMAAGDVLRTGILRNIALEMHHSILKEQGLSEETLHRHMLECGYRKTTEFGPEIYSFAA